MTRNEARILRQVSEAVDVMYDGRIQDGVDLLCRLARRDRVVLELGNGGDARDTRPADEIERREPGGVGENGTPPAQNAGDAGSSPAASGDAGSNPARHAENRPIVSQPKPRARLVDPRAITAFNKTHRACATKGPDCHGPIEFSHIKSRADGGDDVAHNAIPQCRWHHQTWEDSPVVWWRVFSCRLSPLDRGKVLYWHPLLADETNPRRGGAMSGQGSVPRAPFNPGENATEAEAHEGTRPRQRSRGS